MPETIVITGASSGIGQATALFFHKRGWNVVATMRKPEDDTELHQLDNILVTRLDVTDSASISAAIDAAVGRFGSLDALVNNAGYGAFGPLEAFSMDRIRRQFDTNVFGLLEVTKAVLPRFRTQGSGVIVNISSIGGRMTFPLGTLYHGSKFAVEGISEALHFELAPLGIEVKIVEPGMIATRFSGGSLDFQNDTSLIEYQHIVGTLHGLMTDREFMQHASSPSVVSQAIWDAVTDRSGRLRYTAGDDARELMAARSAQDDATFIGGIKRQFGL